MAYILQQQQQNIHIAYSQIHVNHYNFKLHKMAIQAVSQILIYLSNTETKFIKTSCNSINLTWKEQTKVRWNTFNTFKHLYTLYISYNIYKLVYFYNTQYINKLKCPWCFWVLLTITEIWTNLYIITNTHHITWLHDIIMEELILDEQINIYLPSTPMAWYPIGYIIQHIFIILYIFNFYLG
jgi:hypothetical protein